MTIPGFLIPSNRWEELVLVGFLGFMPIFFLLGRYIL